MLLDVNALTVRVRQKAKLVTIVDQVSLQIDRGEILGLIGESGSGKSMTARSLIRLVPSSAEVTGVVNFDNVNVLGMERPALARHRGHDVGFIFQDSAAHINPVRTIGDFLTEPILTEKQDSKYLALRRAAIALEEVGFTEPGKRLRQFPHHLSGGMLQRVMIASVLMRKPRLIIADEPTTALDLVTQSDIMAMLRQIRDSRGTSVLFISHDLELAAATCDNTAVMYAGTLVEQGRSIQIETRPAHPYTAALVGARPRIHGVVAPLSTIPGRSTAAFEAPTGCVFSDRCVDAQSDCRTTRPSLRNVGSGYVACHHPRALADAVSNSQVIERET